MKLADAERQQGPFAAAILRAALCGGLSVLGKREPDCRRGLERAREHHREWTAILIAEALERAGAEDTASSLGLG